MGGDDPRSREERELQGRGMPWRSPREHPRMSEVGDVITIT